MVRAATPDVAVTPDLVEMGVTENTDKKGVEATTTPSPSAATAAKTAPAERGDSGDSGDSLDASSPPAGPITPESFSSSSDNNNDDDVDDDDDANGGRSRSATPPYATTTTTTATTAPFPSRLMAVHAAADRVREAVASATVTVASGVGSSGGEPTIAKEHWVPDKAVTHCYNERCGAEFKLMVGPTFFLWAQKKQKLSSRPLFELVPSPPFTSGTA